MYLVLLLMTKALNVYAKSWNIFLLYIALLCSFPGNLNIIKVSFNLSVVLKILLMQESETLVKVADPFLPCIVCIWTLESKYGEWQNFTSLGANKLAQMSSQPWERPWNWSRHWRQSLLISKETIIIIQWIFIKESILWSTF